jgi:hypothetical protein
VCSDLICTTVSRPCFPRVKALRMFATQTSATQAKS